MKNFIKLYKLVLVMTISIIHDIFSINQLLKLSGFEEIFLTFNYLTNEAKISVLNSFLNYWLC